MSNFNIQELIEHADSCTQEIRGRWYPVRPLQLTGLGGLKLRIKGAIQVLLGKADTVEWSLRPVKTKKVTVPKDMTMSIVENVNTPMPEGFDYTTLKIEKYIHPTTPGTQRNVPRPVLTPVWGTLGITGGILLGELQSGSGCKISLLYDVHNNRIKMTGARVVDVMFTVK